MTKKCFLCCSLCFESNADIQQKFFISNCYHVFCAGCLAQNSNYCSVCNQKCKMLPIDENLPKEVKSYFDPNSHQNMLTNLVKIQNFQQEQVKRYVEKNYVYRKQYYETKQKIQHTQGLKKQLQEGIRRERMIMERLKQAYKTNVITPDLFQMRSPLIDVNQQNTRSPEAMSTSSSGSLFDRNSLSERMETSSTGSSLQFINSAETISIPRRLSIEQQQGKIVHDYRKAIFTNAVRDVKHPSQARSQARSGHYRPY